MTEHCRTFFPNGDVTVCIPHVPLHNGNIFVVIFRDKLTSDDCVGTYYLAMSEISGQGEEG